MSRSLPELLLQEDSLYLFESGDGQIIFRPLTYREYKTVKKCIDYFPAHNIETEDWIWDNCVIEHSLGSSHENVKAGTIVTLLNCILRLSCPVSIDEANESLLQNRQEFNDVLEQATILICQAFPNYTTKMVQNMHWEKIIGKLAESEIILGKQLDFKKSATPTDDSHKIFSALDRMSKDNLDVIMAERPVNFEKENQKLNQV